MFERLRSERGFGLVELVVAIVVVNVGLLAIAAVLQSGAVSARRASRVATATTIADAQLERFRALTFDLVGLDASAPLDAAHTADAAYTGSTPVVRTCGSPAPAECLPTQTAAGPDGGSYRLDTYVARVSDRLRRVTVVVRDASRPLASPALARVASTFDASA